MEILVGLGGRVDAILLAHGVHCDCPAPPRSVPQRRAEYRNDVLPDPLGGVGIAAAEDRHDPLSEQADGLRVIAVDASNEVVQSGLR